MVLEVSKGRYDKGTIMKYSVERFTVPEFEIVRSPLIRIGRVTRKRFNIIDSCSPTNVFSRMLKRIFSLFTRR